MLEVAHAAGSGGLSALGLLAPVVLAGLSSGIAARGAGVLLDVKGATTATPAQSVRLVMALAKAGSSLRHFGSGTRGFVRKGGGVAVSLVQIGRAHV